MNSDSTIDRPNPHTVTLGQNRDWRAEQSILYIGTNAIYICAKMVGLGYSGLTFTSLRKAGEWLGHRAAAGLALPDAIVCDSYLGLPQVQQFVENQRVSGKLRTIPFILLTERVDKAARQGALQVKADDIYDYDLDPTALSYRIDSLQKVKQAQNALQAENPTPMPKLPVAAQLSAAKKNGLGRQVQAWAKRILDITAAAVGLLILSPLFIVVAILTKLDSRGPVFYISKRVGRNYQIFNFYKFRTMRTDADQMLQQVAHLNQYSEATAESKKAPVFVKINNDPRVTKLGRFLRNTSIDELPQLFNVLKGDMSLVGNRPLPVYEAKTLTQDQWAMRFLAPAGLTGLWQVSKRGKGEMSIEERMALDVEYANSNNFLGDIKLLIRTPMAMKQGANV
jgi:lipopolysaccharide/colanic/teichoic acid biosynthesis glycosyltransferase/CheY-like chemotaxis protein